MSSSILGYTGSGNRQFEIFPFVILKKEWKIGHEQLVVYSLRAKQIAGEV